MRYLCTILYTISCPGVFVHIIRGPCYCHTHLTQNRTQNRTRAVPLDYLLNPEHFFSPICEYRSMQSFYYLYDANTFLADVRGYMGLLLGHSIFSFCDALIAKSEKLHVKMFYLSKLYFLCGIFNPAVSVLHN
jgi:hypothetical protein